MGDVVRRFDTQVAETQSGADEVKDFVRKTLYAFPWTDMLVPAPMAVAILGQLTLVAATTDFKLAEPKEGFKYVKYPDSFRATIVQLVNTGTIALNQSFADFDEINKRCAAIRPGVNNIIQLLIGDEDSTPQENNLAIQKYLPSQVESLQHTISACLQKAQESDDVFHRLLELTMEIHESCTATQGENEKDVKDANIRHAILEEQKKAAEEIKKHCAEEAIKANEDLEHARKLFEKAADSMPTGMELALTQLVDAVSQPLRLMGELLTWKIIEKSEKSAANQDKLFNNLAGGSNKTSSESNPSVVPPNVDDFGYQKAAVLRSSALTLSHLLTSADDGGIDWNAIKAKSNSPCAFVRMTLTVLLEELDKKISRGHKGKATITAKTLGSKGVKYATELGDSRPSANMHKINQLAEEILAWKESALTFSAEADIKLGPSLLNNNHFLPNSQQYTDGSTSFLAIQSAQYKLSVTDAQLTASRENTRQASNKIRDVTANIGDIMAQIAGLDVQKIEWQKITQILLRAISLLSTLKGCLNNLVHFFDAVNNIVSISLKESANQFIQVVQDATKPSDGAVVKKNMEGLTLDGWARQAIYMQAVSAAKVGRLVENISQMYVELYNYHIHPGVNKLLEMGNLIASEDQAAIGQAGADIQLWAGDARDKIQNMVCQRMTEFESDIQLRQKQLEQSIGGILPPSRQIEAIVTTALDNRVEQVAEAMSTVGDEKPISKKNKLFV